MTATHPAVLQAQLSLAATSTTDAVRWRNPRLRPVPWQLELGRLCDRVIDSAFASTGLRVTESAPPRHGKSEWNGRGMPVRVALQAAMLDRQFGVLYATSSKDRAEEVSGRVRSAVERLHEQTGSDFFAPGRVWKVTEWETEGGLGWVGCGWESRIGGIGANLLVMDDMIGSSTVYRSAAQRRAIQRVVQEDLLSRLMDGGAAIQMETRRGLDDTTGWLLAEYPGIWEEHVWRCYDPARGRGLRDPVTGRDPSAYLWPAMYGEAWRQTMPHLTDSSPVWRALYQQEPVPEGGTLLQSEWVHATYEGPPEAAHATAEFVVIGCDLTNTRKKTSDPAAFVVVARRGAYFDVIDVVVRRCGYVEQKQILRGLVARWRPHAVIVERAAGGDAMVDELAGEIPGLRGEFPSGDKVTRLNPHLGRFAALQVRTPAGHYPWAAAWRQEMAAFTGLDGELDNQVDATVWALVGAGTPNLEARRRTYAGILGR